MHNTKPYELQPIYTVYKFSVDKRKTLNSGAEFSGEINRQ